MDAFTLVPGTWKSWQMFPGYVGERMTPYCSPIHIHRVEPLKSGKGVLRLNFFNALYAQGVQDFQVDLKVLKRAQNYLLAEFRDDPERAAIIGHLELPWLQSFCPDLVSSHLPESCVSVSSYLDQVFARNISS